MDNAYNGMFIEDLLEAPLDGLTLVYGPAASGKTTLALEALRGRSVVVATARNLSPERLRAMRADADAVLAKLALFEPRDLDALERAVREAVRLSRVADILVVDSLGTYLRVTDRRAANLALERILQALSTASCPVIITTDVLDRPAGDGELRFVGGDMLRLAAGTIVELRGGVATVRKHPVLAGRVWQYRIADAGLEKI